ncbi:3-dehydroquinate synthase [Bacillus sp. B15-48]|uniref:3-dehydroquinate synthase n=1 Tax=Bacillus sp. B15-48 TaxID=1548601 RepID=UPI00193FD9F1|nr:3-dehydroquinate synthase [Bacillus sp. B15-48]MBM4762122.1 3-dehydroquinate synthase [Bacillus sp. B15-48]
MEKITIRAGNQTYPVLVGFDVKNHLNAFIKEQFPQLTSILIITDETVGDLYLDTLIEKLEFPSIRTKIVPAGENAKTFEVFHDCLTYALEEKLDRKSLILSFGGGAVGDLAGFVAATFMRGIPFIQIPTTILAHDSAVGGKVAINHSLGKNMIGAFYQPSAVFYDLNFLKSLPASERRSGFAEVIKHALIHDRKFYLWLLENIGHLEQLSDSDVVLFLTEGIKVKGSIVEQDVNESGVRAHLNFGHTLGHAIEAEVGYGSITHGEAVAIGMLFALKLSTELYSLSLNLQEFAGWLEQLGYRTELPENLSVERLINRMKQDKKSVGQTIRFVLLPEFGKPKVDEIKDDYLFKKLEEFQKG